LEGPGESIPRAFPHSRRFAFGRRPAVAFHPGVRRLAKATLAPHHLFLMTTATWTTMLGILTFIWGGFFLALRTAIRKESEKGGD